VSDLEQLLQAVAEVARLAGDVANGYFGAGVRVELKQDGSPVTIADRAAEQVARDWIARRFPDDAILGEEFGTGGAAGHRRWLIDPIDGTKSFVAGVPLWGTLIAVVDGEDVCAGAINCAAANEMVVAARGLGCWSNDIRCRVSDCAAIETATILTTDERFPDRPERRAAWSTLAARARVVRTWGDCFGYLLVATGRAEVMVDDKMNPWDSACLLPIIEEAGGVLTDWRGVRTAFGGDTIATNGALAGPTRALLVPGHPSGTSAALDPRLST
jgi:histidinol phosphatase-like enzyme (inositol monophosphatase family)